MAVFNDLAIELQEAIWKLALPASRGVHWIEVEGIPHYPEYIRESIRLTQWHNFDHIPERHSDIHRFRNENPGFDDRPLADDQEPREASDFFRHLLTTVPAVFGRSGSSGVSEDLRHELADELSFTRRCRQLSTYYHISALLSVCRLSRHIAEQYIKNNFQCSWPIHRSMGPPYRTRPMNVWEVQYSGNKAPLVSRDRSCWQELRPRIHTHDLVVLRLYDSQGRATPLLKQSPWQYYVDQPVHWSTFGCFDRIGIEWHPSWANADGQGELHPYNVETFLRNMCVGHTPATLYWMVDGVPRPNWERDYPAIVGDLFANRMAEEKEDILSHLKSHWGLSSEGQAATLVDQHLGQEFEANGRRYYIVFVVLCNFRSEQKKLLKEAGLGNSGPFPGDATMWPEAIREPARLAYNVQHDGSGNMGMWKGLSYILSWEPIHKS